MAKIFITGSSDGIGLYTAQELIKLGHEVVLHARNQKRAEELQIKLSKPCKILIADLLIFDELKQLANEVNALGMFDTIIHNAGVYQSSQKEIFQINVLAPYILTALIDKPKQLIYIGSNMHPQGIFDFEKIVLKKEVDYSTSKLLILMMGLAVSRYYKDVCVNVVDPGWVKTKMANYNAPDSLEDGSATQIWLASNDNLGLSGKYFYHLQETIYSTKADDVNTQDELIEIYEKITKIKFPHYNK